MKLSREEVLHIALLARMGITDDEVDTMSDQLSNILENFEALQKVDTDNVPPTAQSIALKNVTSDDAVSPSMSTDDVLTNAPDQEDNHLKIKAVLEDHSI